MTQRQTISYGVWDTPPCVYCGDPIEATCMPRNAPQYIPVLAGWAHARCYRAVGNGAPRAQQAALITLEGKEATE